MYDKYHPYKYYNVWPAYFIQILQCMASILDTNITMYGQYTWYKYYNVWPAYFIQILQCMASILDTNITVYSKYTWSKYYNVSPVYSIYILQCLVCILHTNIKEFGKYTWYKSGLLNTVAWNLWLVIFKVGLEIVEKMMCRNTSGEKTTTISPVLHYP